MSSEKNAEVVGCDASIMKNVWEIRQREYEHKMQQEHERREKSALPSINQDWSNRLAAKQGVLKRVEKKSKPTENPPDNNVWKSNLSRAPPSLPRGKGSGPISRPGCQSRGFSTPAHNNNDKKGQENHFKRLQSLMFISQTQPSAMVWGKSWKYKKCLPLSAEGNVARSNWGQCWMFATQQPQTEPGTPWLNGPNTNLTEADSLHLWKKPDNRMVESQELDLSISTEEWQMSWRKSDKNKMEDASSINGEHVAKFGFFTSLVETQHQNEGLSSSEWSESWKSTKPASQKDPIALSNDGLMNESIAEKQDNDRGMSSKWKECWRLVNHHGSNKSKVPQKSHNPEWANSWKAAMVVFNNHKNSDQFRQDPSGTYEDQSQLRESHLHKVMLVSREQKHRDRCVRLCNEFNTLSEWSKSWQVTKNNSKPCEEMEKVLKNLPPRMETALETQKMGNNTNEHYSTLEKADSCYEQLKHDVIYHPKKEFAQSKLRHLKHLENVMSAKEWMDSWKTLKHRMRMERRRLRPDLSRPFTGSEQGGDMKPNASEWKDSWKFHSQPLRQEPEPWQQGWSSTPQIRVDRARVQNHFVPVELHKNGPTVESIWGESWRFSRRQHQSEPGQRRAQTSQAGSSVASHHPGVLQAQRRYAMSLNDWQVAWMVSETQFHHDRPSLTQWREAWRWSVFHTENWSEQGAGGNEVDVLMEIQSKREKLSLQRAKDKMSRSFDNQTFRERYPEKQWEASWRVGSLLSNQTSQYGTSGIPGKKICGTQQQHTTDNGHGSKWGRSFRIANPMPHMEQPWVESAPNQCHYTVMWSRGKNIQNINKNVSNNPATLKLWGTSHRFLPGASAQTKDKTTKKPVDPRVIIPNKAKSRKHLYSNIEKEKQSQNKWAGCHLLGKTQPRPKRGPASRENLKMEDKTAEKFFEEWVESWRLSVRPGSLKKQMPVKSFSGWDESWKCLIPPYPPKNGPKAK
ncbi:uncharacterized protein LOC117959325 [Etheostoma cragini]|uniref:uncharacterized protein LOC117959325 n=1 Tax=Etheostoma cragini TaxID=417921 RepID=UPI00155EFFFE|nr:uncharacterized protein LOC117959325 [Etheostoma cragini]